MLLKIKTFFLSDELNSVSVWVSLFDNLDSFLSLPHLPGTSLLWQTLYLWFLENVLILSTILPSSYFVSSFRGCARTQVCCLFYFVTPPSLKCWNSLITESGQELGKKGRLNHIGKLSQAQLTCPLHLNGQMQPYSVPSNVRHVRRMWSSLWPEGT